MGWKMGLMDYAGGAYPAVQAYLAAKNNKQKQQESAARMALEQRRMALEEQRLQALMEAQKAGQLRQGLLDQRTDTTWQQQQDDRQAGLQRQATKDFDYANAGVSNNLPGLMSMGAIDQTSSDPRMLAQAARGQLPGMEQPSAWDYAQIEARHGNPKELVNLQKSDETNATREAIAEARAKQQAEALAAKLENAIKILEMRNDAQSQLQAQKLEAVLEQIKLKAGLQKETAPRLTDADKRYQSHVADAKAKGEKPMSRHDFDIWYYGQTEGIRQKGREDLAEIRKPFYDKDIPKTPTSKYTITNVR